MLRSCGRATLIFEELDRGQRDGDPFGPKLLPGGVSTHEFGLRGRFVKVFAHLPGYRRFQFREGGMYEAARDGVAFKDLMV